jgi:hypothetical protein
MKMACTAVLLAFAVGLASAASAETLYKLIDKNGKVTYSESKPEHFEGQAIRIDVNTEANTMPAPRTSPTELSPPNENEKIIRRRAARPFDKVDEARTKAEEACKKFETARDNPGEDDVIWVAVGAGDPVPSGPPVAPAPPPPTPPTGPTVPNQSKPPVVGPNPIGKRTGARPMPTDEYAARLTGLEKACNDAKEQARVAEAEAK